MFRELFAFAAFLGVAVRIGETLVALTAFHPVGRWLDAVWVVGWLGVVVVAVGCYRLGDRIDLESGARAGLGFIGAIGGGGLVGYGGTAVILIGLGLEETLTPIGAVIVGAFIGMLFAVGGIGGIGLRTAAGGEVVTGTRSAIVAGSISLFTAVLSLAGYGYESESDVGLFVLFGGYFLLLARLQRAQRGRSDGETDTDRKQSDNRNQRSSR